MKAKHSKQELEYLKDGDFWLLNTSYEKAMQAGDKEFKVPISGFEGSPEANKHISQFVLSNGLSYKSDGLNFVFRIA